MVIYIATKNNNRILEGFYTVVSASDETTLVTREVELIVTDD